MSGPVASGIESVAAGISPELAAMVNERSTEAIWVSEGGHPEPEVKTLDIDSVLNRRA